MTITSEPVGAEVVQEGRPLGQTPLTLTRVPVGAAVYTVRRNGYQTRQVGGEVAAGLAAGRLQAGQSYRLPTDREWSRAAGLPEEPGDTPEARDGRVRGFYPWGKQWPPPAGAGNFAASEVSAGSKRPRRRLTPGGEPYTQTAPVGSFAPDALKPVDMAGNVWQWCADNYKKNGALRRWGVLRGGSWADYGPTILQSSYRNVVPGDERDVIYGFRCVIDLDAPPAPSPRLGSLDRQ